MDGGKDERRKNDEGVRESFGLAVRSFDQCDSLGPISEELLGRLFLVENTCLLRAFEDIVLFASVLGPSQGNRVLVVCV